MAQIPDEYGTWEVKEENGVTVKCFVSGTEIQPAFDNKYNSHTSPVEYIVCKREVIGGENIDTNVMYRFDLTPTEIDDFQAAGWTVITRLDGQVVL